MSSTETLAQSSSYCREVIRRHAHSFYFASQFLPAHKRQDVFVLYAFYRTVDDLVDCRPVDRSRESVAEELDSWRCWLRDPLAHSCHDLVQPALRDVIQRHAIPVIYLEELLEGVQGDLMPRHLQTFAELERYCYLVAGSVGLVMSYVLGMKDTRALEQARALGIAMQLTNVLRDIGEDLEHNTIYLPAEELACFGYSAERLAYRQVDREFIDLMCMQITRARHYYNIGIRGIDALERDSQFAILLAARMYGRILHKIESSGYDVFSGRAHTKLWEKVWIAGRSYVGLRLPGGQPRVS